MPPKNRPSRPTNNQQPLRRPEAIPDKPVAAAAAVVGADAVVVAASRP
jgi:hypothetical protein